MSKRAILIAALVALSLGGPALIAETAPLAAKTSLPAAVRIELTWNQRIDQATAYAITGKGLGTFIGPNLILTHNHFRVPPAALGTGTLTVINPAGHALQLKMADAQLILISANTTLIWLPTNVVKPFAPVADLATVQRLAGGDWLTVSYWADPTNQLAQQDFKIMRIQNGVAQLADPRRVINSGDSGGGAYFNGKLVGNIWSINLDRDRQPAGSFNIALLPSQVLTYAGYAAGQP